MTLVISRRQPNKNLKLGNNLNPLLRKVLSQRDIDSAAQLDLAKDKLLSPFELLGINQAVDLLLDVRSRQERVLIVSDFDADGATSCVLAIQALHSMGFTHVDYIVPNRFEYGYGLTPEIVELAKARNPQLIITVDNGISSHEGVESAQQAGIKVLITDHHLPGEELPTADAIVNPNQPDCMFPSKCLAGVGVIFYLMLALRARLRETNWFTESDVKEPNLAEHLDLVALGTVADVVPLDQNNRILVNEGVRRIRAGKTRAGILALLEIGKRARQNLVAGDLGFALGPRLNAAGRLDDMSLGIECLLAESESEAFPMAIELDRLNSDRKLIENKMRQEAFRDLEQIAIDEDRLEAGLCLYQENWHQGVIGILASRIKDKYHRPVIAFANSSEDQDGSIEIKGSARSITGFHIRDALDAIAAQNPGLISKFGGHAMAAGLSLNRDSLADFSRAFANYAENHLDEQLLSAKILSDGELEQDQFTLESAQALVDAGPWGQGFPEPLFDGVFTLRELRVLADKHLKMVVSPANSELLLDAIAFNVGDTLRPEQNSHLKLVYRLDVNHYQGTRKVQLIVEQIEVQ